MTATTTLQHSALGLGLRPAHYGEIFASEPAVDFFEVLSENFMHTGGRPLRMLDRIAERFPVVLHGVSMNVAGTDRLDRDYLRELRALQRRCSAAWIGDHLCWTAIDGVQMHDLLPIPYDEATLEHVAARVRRIQDVLEQPLVLENPSTYLRFATGDFDEASFLAALVERTDCRLLVDVNNVYVSAVNHGSDPEAWLRRIPWANVVYLHVAGHTVNASHLVDTHDHPVCPAVWKLHALAQQLSGGKPTVLERDDRIPSLAELTAELHRAHASRQPRAFTGVAS